MLGVKCDDQSRVESESETLSSSSSLIQLDHSFALASTPTACSRNPRAMEFATSLLSSASTALAAAQKPTLAGSYTPDPAVAPLSIGVWKVTRAKHNSNGKQVSIWQCDKHALVSNSALGGGALSTRRSANSARDRDGDRLKDAIDTLKKEASHAQSPFSLPLDPDGLLVQASSLSRLRHPCILEMAEPPSESRSSIMFATEPVLSSLRHSLDVSASAATSRRTRTREEEELELDEVEVQKGMSQLGKGLQFLHDSAKLVHGNLTPEAVIINAKVSKHTRASKELRPSRQSLTLSVTRSPNREIGNCLDSDCRLICTTLTASPRNGSFPCLILPFLAQYNATTTI